MTGYQDGTPSAPLPGQPYTTRQRRIDRAYLDLNDRQRAAYRSLRATEIPHDLALEIARQVDDDVCPDCGGQTFWSEDAQDWLHEASDAPCYLNAGPTVMTSRKPHVSADQKDLGGYVSQHDQATLQQVADAFDISLTQAKRKLDGLVAQGLLDRDGVLYLVPGTTR